MNTIINFELAKLLKEKKFTSVLTSYSNKYFNNLGEYKIVSYDIKIENDEYEAPSIAEIIMWLYERHGIWINVTSEQNRFYKWEYRITCKNKIIDKFGIIYNENLSSPTEAYSAAIEYCLKKLI